MSLTGVGEVADLAKDLIDRFIPDKTQEEKDKAAALLQQQLTQVQANAADAASSHITFRDGAGWVCVAAMAFDFIIRPLGMWITGLFGLHVEFPSLDVTILGQMLFALLGLGYMHMNENIKTQ